MKTGTAPVVGQSAVMLCTSPDDVDDRRHLKPLQKSLKSETEGTIAADDKDQKSKTEIDVGDRAVVYGEMPRARAYAASDRHSRGRRDHAPVCECRLYTAPWN